MTRQRAGTRLNVEQARRFVVAVRLCGRPGADNIRRLRAILKRLGRRYGLRCIAAREVRR